MPLVNEVVIPVGQKDKWNGSKPVDDAQFLSYVTDPEVPKLLQLVYGIPAPATPRNDLVQVFLTGVPGLNQPAGVKASEMLRLNTDILPTASPARLGVLAATSQGFPNGRRLTDDVIDITLQAAAGVLGGVKTSLGDGVDRNDVAFRTTFPYLAFPHSGGNAVEAEPQRRRSSVAESQVEPSTGHAQIPDTCQSRLRRDHRRGGGDGRGRQLARRAPQPRSRRRGRCSLGTRGAGTGREDLDRRIAELRAASARQPDDVGAAVMLARRAAPADARDRQHRPGDRSRGGAEARARRTIRPTTTRTGMLGSAAICRSTGFVKRSPSARRIATRGRTIRSTTASSATAISSSVTTTRRSTRSTR